MAKGGCCFCGSSGRLVAWRADGAGLCAPCSDAERACGRVQDASQAPVAVTSVGVTVPDVLGPLQLRMQSIDHWPRKSMINAAIRLPAEQALRAEGLDAAVRWTIQAADGREVTSVPVSEAFGDEWGHATFRTPPLIDAPSPWTVRVEHRDTSVEAEVCLLGFEAVEPVPAPDVTATATALIAPVDPASGACRECCATIDDPARTMCRACSSALAAYIDARSATPPGSEPTPVTIARRIEVPGTGDSLTVLGIDLWPDWLSLRYHATAAAPLRARWQIHTDHGHALDGFDLAGGDADSVYGQVAFAGRIPNDLAELHISLLRADQRVLHATATTPTNQEEHG